MDSVITRAKIDIMRNHIKKYKPFENSDPTLNQYDGEYDIKRENSTGYMNALTALGINPYDDNDYGDIKD